MQSLGLPTTVYVTKLAEAHASVFKAMNNNASGRYIRFDKVIDSQIRVENLDKEIGVPKEKICGEALKSSVQRFELSVQII